MPSRRPTRTTMGAYTRAVPARCTVHSQGCGVAACAGAALEGVLVAAPAARSGASTASRGCPSRAISEVAALPRLVVRAADCTAVCARLVAWRHSLSPVGSRRGSSTTQAPPAHGGRCSSEIIATSFMTAASCVFVSGGSAFSAGAAACRSGYAASTASSTRGHATGWQRGQGRSVLAALLGHSEMMQVTPCSLDWRGSRPSPVVLARP
jgi:hypothetical protein